MEAYEMEILDEEGPPPREAPVVRPKPMEVPKKGAMTILGTNNYAEPKTKVVINRRSPFISFEKLGVLPAPKNTSEKKVVKGRDPMLEHNPLLGRLAFMLMINFALVLIFLTELVFNKITFNGRCTSSVLYPAIQPGHDYVKPYIVEFGYGACEYNLRTDAANRVFFGTAASDDGWPKSLLQSGITAASSASVDAPNERVYTLLGGINTNMIRNYDEYFRLFWSMFLHSSWKHLIFNVFCQVQALWIIEPMQGGCVFGMLWGFFTIKSVSSCDKCTIVERSLLSPLFSWLLPQSWKAKLRLIIIFKKDRGDRYREKAIAQKLAAQNGVTPRHIAIIKKKFDRQGGPPCRMRLRECILRLISLIVMLILFTIFGLFLLKPELYAKFKPPGEYKFAGWQTCECCFITNIERVFNGNRDIPEQYRNRKLFWCFSKIDDAKHFCGEDYAKTAPMNNLLESSQDAARGILSTVTDVINSV
ncbi:hypothetical protein BaOVIS_023010 [Babesia ovis]|uniref:Rhomboid-like protease n=1 Tax=Babesia ovis TaxID=5869 RepID=A0A9W5WW14_BABOV|nr:hypothetical protein BaOVIS_023010 [Babesia ovis]